MRLEDGSRLKSSIDYGVPDEKAYTLQKGIKFIREESLVLPTLESHLPLPEVAWIGDTWRRFHGLVIGLTATGEYHKDGFVYPRPFPGAIVPGPLHSTQYIGSSAVEIFSHLLTIPQRVIDPDLVDFEITQNRFIYNGKKPELEITPIATEPDWQWQTLQPDLSQIQLTLPSQDIDHQKLEHDKSKILSLLNTQIRQYVYSIKTQPRVFDHDSTRTILQLIQLVQDPFVGNEIPDRVVETASQIVNRYIRGGQEIEWLPLLFQIESSLMYAHTVASRDVIADGFFAHSWLEVARTPIEKLISTELVNDGRAITEVVNFINRGWAPIITDERLNNTDGSHRGIASRIWSLLKHLHSTGVTNLNVSNPHLQEQVQRFIARRSDMTGLTLRETLRITQNLLTKHEHKQSLRTITNALPNLPDIKFVATLLLREQEAACVVKSPFDNEGRVIGVDPFVTYTLTANNQRSWALGSRGPYHRTDKSPAPWFDITRLQY